MKYFSDEKMIRWSWMVQRNDQKIPKCARGSQYSNVDPRSKIAK
jgi:hypothetical protein